MGNRVGAAAGAPIERRASFARLRYANCWEDAEVLADALGPLEGASCVSIASAGDNTFSLLARGAARVVAVDLSPAQLALVALKRAAFLLLDHGRLLAFLGVRPAGDRLEVYAALRARLDAAARGFWDRHRADIEAGVVHAGRLEGYFRLFRRWVLPLAHRAATVQSLFQPRTPEERERFHREVWDTRAWRLVCRAFFSRAAMGRLGRDREFFRHAPGDVAAHVLARARQAIVTLPPEDNPYLRYVLTGRFDEALPDYLRPERYDAIRAGLGRLHLRAGPIEAVVGELDPGSVDAFNLSDVAEYMDLSAYHRLLEVLRRVAAPGARLAYWNLLAERRRPAAMAEWLDAREEQAAALHAQARAFFYRALVIEVAR